MAYLLDILGATAIGAFVIFMVLQVNNRIISFSNDMFLNSISQMEAVDTDEIFQYDFYKAGYKSGGNKILTATANQIRFVGDLNNNGTPDTIHYTTGDTTQLSNTQNPDDFPLYRSINGVINIVSQISALTVSYYDSLGTKLTYASLMNQLNRNKIRSIQLDVRFESPEPYDGFYQGVDYRRTFIPKNLR